MRVIDGTIQDVGVWRNFELCAIYNEPKLTANVREQVYAGSVVCNVRKSSTYPKKIPICKTQFKIKEERRKSRWLKIMEVNGNSGYECGGERFRRRKVVKTAIGR